jgi:hypothetical protein
VMRKGPGAVARLGIQRGCDDVQYRLIINLTFDRYSQLPMRPAAAGMIAGFDDTRLRRFWPGVPRAAQLCIPLYSALVEAGTGKETP